MSLNESACEAGVLSIMFARNCFDKLDSKVLDVKISLDKKCNSRCHRHFANLPTSQLISKIIFVLVIIENN